MSTHTILNLGAGVQSTALYLMGIEGQIAFETAVFSDVGAEPAEVYRHLEWLKSLGGPRIVTVSAGNIGDDLMRGENTTGQRFASIPAFTTHTEGVPVGRMRRQCTREYKIAPIDQWLRRELLGLSKGQRAPAGTVVFQLFGISLDETARATRIQANTPPNGWRRPVFPLHPLDEGKRIPHPAALRVRVLPLQEKRRMAQVEGDGPGRMGAGFADRLPASETRGFSEPNPRPESLPSPDLPAVG
jgi:hypothetical protein